MFLPWQYAIYVKVQSQETHNPNGVNECMTREAMTRKVRIRGQGGHEIKPKEPMTKEPMSKEAKELMAKEAKEHMPKDAKEPMIKQAKTAMVKMAK